MAYLSEPFSVCFNLLKMKYKDYDESLTQKNILQENDKVNIFINFEAVLKNMSTIRDLENKLVLQRDFKTIVISNTLNLIGHYKRFLVNNGLDTRVYLYMTDLESTSFAQCFYNEDYRSYFINKYMKNHRYVFFTDILRKEILPEIKTYCAFIPDVYFISSKNIEGSLIPYIIAKDDTSRKNLIISGDLYDSQYVYFNNFITHIFTRSNGPTTIRSSKEEFLSYIYKKKDVKELDNRVMKLFSNYPLYCGLLSVLGNKLRSIDDIDGIKAASFQKLLEDGIEKKKIQETTSNPKLLREIFSDTEDQEDFSNNFYCTSIDSMYNELTKTDIRSILYQKEDRIDIESLKVLNATEFANYPILLETLLI